MSTNLKKFVMNTSVQSVIKMEPKASVILRDCIENGIKRGYRRAFKYVENPGEDSIFEHIEECIMDEIHEYFFFKEFDS